MKITVIGNSMGFAFLELREFPRLYRAFVSGVTKGTGQNTADLETEGAALLKNGLDDVKRTNDFIRNVLKWGGKTGNRVRGMVYKYQTEAQTAQIVGKAAAALRGGKLKTAIETIQTVKGFHISYGSKILRMLSPRHACVYDSILADFLSYPLDADGYAECCRDCKAVAAVLKKRGIKNPLRKNGEWLIADVEAVIFSQLRMDGYA
ncbi:MAG: hypothetical protein ACR2P5_06055 [Gammaproteobacteria bacterium]